MLQVWERSEQGFRGFQGCGSVWLPMAPGQHHIDVSLWKPTSGGLEGLSGTILSPVLVLSVFVLMFANLFHYGAETLIPTIPDLTAMRELTMSPFLRSQITTATVGTLQLNLSTILSGFKQYGVATC